MAKNLAVQVGSPGGEFEFVEREFQAPGAGEVRIKVAACGICYSDHLVKDGLWPGLTYPRVPGHEVAGVIDALGPGVTTWNRAIASAWVGMVAIASSVRRAGVASSSPARRVRSLASRSTVATSST